MVMALNDNALPPLPDPFIAGNVMFSADMGLLFYALPMPNTLTLSYQSQ